MNCYSCNAALSFTVGQKISRKEECHQCSADMHVCKMCSFYDTTAYNECREPMADRITEKEKANFCDYFQLKGQDNNQNKDDLLSAANALFKK